MSTVRERRKEHTRERLLGAASRLLKRRGFDGTSVAAVMGEAELTHGAFYAYFRDKDQMIAAALRWGVDRTLARVAGSLPRELPAAERLRRFLAYYLSPQHRADVADGCPITAHSRDMVDAKPSLRRTFAHELARLVEERRALFDAPEHPMPRARWIGIMCTYVGALQLARACEGEPLSDEVLAAASSFLAEATSRPFA